jgi:predicted kinase
MASRSTRVSDQPRSSRLTRSTGASSDHPGTGPALSLLHASRHRIAELRFARGSGSSEHAGAVPEPVLALISGLPGVGKSTLCQAVTPRLSATVVSRDESREASVPSGLRRAAEVLAWRLRGRRLTSTTGHLAARVERDLAVGRSVVVEAMADHDPRARMRERAERHAVRLVQVECVCKVAVHHARLADRPPFWPPLVERLRASYEPARPP